jgi:chorismate--pyruvate lyase
MRDLSMPVTNLGAGSVVKGKRDGLAGSTVDLLADRHFTMQRTNLSEPNLEIVSLDPLLRGLLFTDGTVTRALEAQTLCDVAVEVVEQTQIALPEGAMTYLDVAESTECLRRRVTMHTAGATPAVWAESYILAQRLPPGFLGLLDTTAHGIGGSIDQARLESRRELLWFRLGRPPCWAGDVPSATRALIRQYRIVTAGRPALLICEAFAVERREGMYRPLGWTHASHAPMKTVDGSVRTSVE